jgi:hypothetical protein
MSCPDCGDIRCIPPYDERGGQVTTAVALPRVQRRRATGWRKPEGAVIVDRTSRWGNPFTVAEVIAHGLTDNEGDARRLVATRFRSWLLGLTPTEPDVYRVGRRNLDRLWMREHLQELRGKALCCPCPTGQPCHADELSALANG